MALVQSDNQSLHPSVEAAATPSQGRPGASVPSYHYRRERQGDLHAHAAFRAACGGGLTSYGGRGGAVEKSTLRCQGKGGKDRVVYLSKDARAALEAYLATRFSKAKRVFLVQKGPLSGTPLSVRGIQKRIEYYARESTVKVSCHRFVTPWQRSS